MLKTLKNIYRILRNRKKKLKLEHYCHLYDKAPISRVPFEDVKSIALLRWDNKLGDAIMSGLLIKTLQDLRSDIEITVITNGVCADWLEQATKCNIILCDKRSVKTAHSFRQYNGQFDAVIDLGSSFDFKELVAIHELGASYNIGFNKQGHPIFNVNLPLEGEHFKERYLNAAKLFAEEVEGSPSIPVVPFSRSAIVEHDRINIAVNLFGSSKYRQFSKSEAKKFIEKWLEDFPTDCIYLIPVPDKITFLQELITECKNERLKLASNVASLEFTLQLLSDADLCVTPDTSVVHMASALNTPILAIYADDPKNYQEWHPLSDKAEVIFNPAPQGKHDRVYVYEFDWNELKKKRNSLLSK